ncbi:hypothetical protein [Timonella senegalensis]|uniref:hypothetical protein n=1 Tax=Timonella senegalensis TaxID=1465825 RepID=UPI0028A859EA|nr:hypothetical protein [Timonella senegalensis]
MTITILTRPTDTDYKPKHANPHSRETINLRDAACRLSRTRNGLHAERTRRIYGTTWRNDYDNAKREGVWILPGSGARRA